ncbi:MAG: hypothetical protein ACHQD8_00485 [Chitinophagales bacterium]
MVITGLSLTDVAASIRKHYRLITAVTIAAVIVGAMFYILGPQKYKAKTEFILRNPMYGDRTVIYNNDSRLFDYFANEDDLDKIIILSGTDIVQKVVIRNMRLAQAYKIDTTNPEAVMRLENMFNRNMKVTRTEYKDIILTYADADPKLAIAVANECVHVLDNTFSEYYREMRKGMYESILDKIHDQDSAINSLTDTLISLRDQYGIYASKYNIMLNSMKDNIDKKYGRGIEQIQNIELIKDELVADRAGQITLINHYKTGLKDNQLPMIKVVTPAKIPNPPSVLKGILVTLICGAMGFLFSTLIMLFSDSYIVVKNK